jgi:hypothetical protein
MIEMVDDEASNFGGVIGWFVVGGCDVDGG